jgi:hypothetical protein
MPQRTTQPRLDSATGPGVHAGGFRAPLVLDVLPKDLDWGAGKVYPQALVSAARASESGAILESQMAHDQEAPGFRGAGSTFMLCINMHGAELIWPRSKVDGKP